MVNLISGKGQEKPKTYDLMDKPAIDVGKSNGTGKRYPKSILRFPFHNVGNIHPTQKTRWVVNAWTLSELTQRKVILF